MRGAQGRHQSLPVYRQRRQKKVNMSSSQIFSIFAFGVSIIFIFLNFWVGVPRQKQEAFRNVVPSIIQHSDVKMRRVKLEVANDEGEAFLAGATDKYVPVRNGEMLGTWDTSLGLVIDAFDIRTHDPRNLDSTKMISNVKPIKAEEIYFLSAMASTRLFRHSSLNLTRQHIREWIEYMKYAGIQHIYYYDTANTSSESQERALRRYVNKGFVTYFRFHSIFQGHLNFTQKIEREQSAVHCINNFGHMTKWLVFADVNEYLVMPKDPKPGFLERFFRHYETELPNVSQILVQCMLFFGPPQGSKHLLLMEQYTMRKNGTEGVSLNSRFRMTPILRPSLCQNVYKDDLTHFEMKSGTTMALPASIMRKNLYLPRIPSDEQRENLVEDKFLVGISGEIKSMLRKRKSIFGLRSSLS